MSGPMGAGPIEGGMDTTRLSATARDRIAREQRQDDARRYFTRKGHEDLLAVLGLAESAPPLHRRRDRLGRFSGGAA